jgi:hypothetical protein
MKSYLIQTLFISLCTLCVHTLNAQTLSQQSINSMGAYMTSSSSSLSQTVGETMTATWTQGDKILTQGFHQTFKLTLNLKAFLQGYYQGSGIMNDVLYNQGVSAMPTSLTDSITIECRKPFYPFDMLFQEKKCISNNGLVTISHQGLIGEKVYIVLKHRNSLETWSALPIIIEQYSFYDFTTAATKLTEDNQAEVEPGVFAYIHGRHQSRWLYRWI